jgi:hypothetical protein
MSLIDKITSAGKSVARKTGLGLATLAAAASLSGNADAGVINIYNKGQSGVAGSILTIDTLNDSNAEFIPTNIKLGIYALNGSQKLRVLSLPEGSHNIGFYLDVVGGAPLTTTNKLRFEVPDNNSFEKILVYDSLVPETKYEIPLNNGANSVYGVNLTNLINQSLGVYGTWRMEINPFDSGNPSDAVPEPTALFGSVLGLYALSKCGKKRRE